MEPWRKATLDDMPWQTLADFPGVATRFLGESPELGPSVFQVQHGPNYVEARHWHGADTIYVFTAGEMVVDGEATYRPGDVRWVRAGHFYGPERAGADGCEFLLFGSGDLTMHFEPPDGLDRE